MSSEVRVFISHKHRDGPAVQEIAGRLEHYASRRRLRCFVSDYDIQTGEVWRQRIRTELRRSNMLLLLYTDPLENWDWCLYEAGLFTRLDAERIKPVVCVYAGDRPPGPLDNLQGVAAADPGGVRRFLERFYKTTNLFVPGYQDPEAPGAQLALDGKVEDEPLNRGIRNDTLDKLTSTICEKFGRTRSSYPCHRLVLRLDEPEAGAAPTASEALAAARVEDATPGTLLSIFGRDAEGDTWDELVRSIDPERPQRWAHELVRRLDAVVEGDFGRVTYCPITATFRGRDGRIYCPELYRVDLERGASGHAGNGNNGGVMRASRASRIVIIFDSLDAPTVVGDTVFNLIRANFRFRDEVFTVYAGRLRDRIAHEQRKRGVGRREAREAVFRGLDEAVRLIEHEAEIHGFFDDERLAMAYAASPARRRRVRELGQRWEERAGSLRQAIACRDVEDAEAHLGALERLNWQFSVITAEQHLETILEQRDAHARGSREQASRGEDDSPVPMRLVPGAGIGDGTGLGGT